MGTGRRNYFNYAYTPCDIGSWSDDGPTKCVINAQRNRRDKKPPIEDAPSIGLIMRIDGDGSADSIKSRYFPKTPPTDQRGWVYSVTEGGPRLIDYDDF